MPHPEVLAVVPLRLKSTRIPKKILKDIQGAPLCVRSCEAVLRAYEHSSFVKVVAAVDDKVTEDLLKKHLPQLEVILTSPELSSGTDRVFAAVQALISQDPTLRESLKGIINIQGDMPFVGKDGLQSIANFYRVNSSEELKKVPILTLAQSWDPKQKITDSSAVKVICDKEDFAIYFSRWPIPYSRISYKDKNANRSLARLHLGVYAFTLEALARFCAQTPTPLELHEGLEQLRAYWLGMKILVLHTEPKAGESYRGIDVAADLSWAKKFKVEGALTVKKGKKKK